MKKVLYLIHLKFLKNSIAVIILIVAISAGLTVGNAWAQENGDKIYDIGLRVGNLFEVQKAPVSTMPMMSCYVRRALNDSWGVVLSLDSFVFDIEKPGEKLGIETMEESSSIGKASFVYASVDHVFRQVHCAIQPYVQAGIGVGWMDAEDEDNVSSTGAQSYHVDTDAGGSMEVAPTVSLGVRYATQSRWFFDAGARFDYRFTDWAIKDRISGREASIDNFYAWGAYVGFGMKL